jgi:2-dehydro-3-deoxyphosphooctonate aldolase (KDO 8-P synthase)
LARAAAAVGVSGFFMETHPNPEVALSDGPNMIPIHKMADMLKVLQEIDSITKQNGFLEEELS